MRGETTAAVLEGGVACPDLVEFSVYETNPDLFFLWQLISWCRTSMKRRSITRQLIKGQDIVLSH